MQYVFNITVLMLPTFKNSRFKKRKSHSLDVAIRWEIPESRNFLNDEMWILNRINSHI